MTSPVSPTLSTDQAQTLRAYLHDRTDDMLAFLETLVRIESPTSDPEAQAIVQKPLAEALRDLGFRVQRATGGPIVIGGCAGDHLVAFPEGRPAGAPVQLLLGHADTVWPHGTLETMPFEMDREENVVRGPGTFDMKAGLTQMVFALRALRDLDITPTVWPVVMISADEEVGSPTGSRHIRRIAPCCDRALVVEPALGLDGKIKTERKGSGRYTVHVSGKSAHAGLDPDAGSSAILELSHVVQALHELNERTEGCSVNVGTIGGGTRPNVVAAESRAEVDVRVMTQEQAERIDAAIRNLEPAIPGTSIRVEGGISRLPMVQTPASKALWEHAKKAAASIGLDLESGRSGGVSDGNTASQYTPTLDGLGPVGDGAHARHEFCYIDAMPERSTLLAMLIASPPAQALVSGTARGRENGEETGALQSGSVSSKSA